MRPSLVVTDLDGTLASPQGTISAADRATLEALGQENVLRAVATGRSLEGTRKVLDPAFPIDYLVFSSGAGVLDWRTGTILVAHGLSEEEVAEGARQLLALEVDFMVHHPIPRNHHFVFYATGRDNADFHRRLERHRECCLPWDGRSPLAAACQFVVIDPEPRSGALHARLEAALRTFRVIRATSPLDGASAWLEIFSKAVSKSQGAAWVAERHRVPADRVLAVGNDYNDVDLLHWAGAGFLVGNAPAELRPLFPLVATNSESGFSAAVKQWRGKQ